MSGCAIGRLPFPPRRILLLASLALNLFFIGLAVAVGIQETRERAAPAAAAPLDRSPAARIDRLAAALPPADGQALKTRFLAASGAIDAEQLASRTAQDTVRRALAAEPFDAAAADAALARLRETRRTLWRTLHEIIVGAAGDMSASGRARLASWVPPEESGRDASPEPQSRR
ncbi:periplasmic heavy metal sensor [Xanthobacter sp. DSM 24535]|uniref:periplasmic heavy metal sensor n=1 Tax=Roseixanthobacter psychrophilus TaxID=3119917 RepID=UPI0037279C45